MFAPVGYHSLEQIQDYARTVAGNLMVAFTIEKNRYRNSESGSEEAFTSEIEDGTFLEGNMFEAALVRYLLGELGALMCSPSGTVLKMGSQIYYHEDLNHYMNHEWDWGNEMNGLRSEAYKYYNETGIYPQDRFRFIDYSTGTITTLKCVDPELIDLKKVVSNFEGWSVCFAPEKLPSDIDELRKFLGWADYDESALALDGIEIPSRRGRPRKVTEIAKVYLDIFQDGHGSLQREEVARAIKGVIKKEFSLATLDNAMKEARGLKSE